MNEVVPKAQKIEHFGGRGFLLKGINFGLHPVTQAVDGGFDGFSIRIPFHDQLSFDEVQTGIGRTGNWFFAGSELADFVEPDIISLAKSLGSGIPVGACLVNEKVSANIKINDLGTTFGGGMLAMAAVVATLEAIENDGMIANAKRVENQLRDSLASIPSIVSIKGKGC